jgi:hypothetical protein
MTDQMQPKGEPARLAVRVLCKQFADRFVAERDQLAKIAFESDGRDPSVWSFDPFAGTFVPVASADTPTE